MTDVMADCAKKANVKMTTEFKQGALLKKHADITKAAEGEKGICYGPAFAWLGYKSRKSTEQLFDALAKEDPQPIFYKSAYIFEKVQTPGKQEGDLVAAEMCGLKETDSDGKAKEKTFEANAKGKMIEMTKWFNSAKKNERFFIINTGLHAMAAVGDGRGACAFFDPNYGVVVSNNTSDMANFLYDYFRNQDIKRYFKAMNRPMKVTKFKSA